jgi:hypothetical protein
MAARLASPRPRRLADEIDRLDALLDGLSDGLLDFVRDCVRTAVAESLGTTPDAVFVQPAPRPVVRPTPAVPPVSPGQPG